MTIRRPTIAIALAGVLAMPTLAVAAPDPQRSLRLEVDVSALPKEDRYTEDTRRWVLETQTAALEDAGFTVTDNAADVIRIEISRYGEYGIHTRATLMLVGDPGSAREFTCEACKDSDFIAKVDEQTQRLAEELRSEHEDAPAPAVEAPAVVEESSASVDGEAVEGTKPEANEPPADRRGKALGSLGYAGIASLAAGVGLTVGGIVVLLEDPSRRLLPGQDNDIEVTDRTPLGAGLTGVGAALLVAGAALLVTDQTVLRKRRDSKTQASIFVPTLWSTGAGFSWTARF